MQARYWHGLKKSTNPIGFGCWQIAGNHSIDGTPHGWGTVNENEAVNLLLDAINSGIDFFDTAQSYNNGKSEELLGTVIKQTKKEIVVCTKIALTEDEIKNKKLANDFFQRVEASLKRLNLNRIDILLIHNPPDDLEWKKFDYGKLNELQTQGKIGTFGVSSKSLNGAIKVVEANFGTVVEWVFNVFERRPTQELFPLIEKNKFNFIARSPLSRGLINPKYINQQVKFNSDDFRSTLQQDWINWTISSVKKFHHNGIAVDDLIKQSITYCIQHKTVTSVIIGIKTQKQLEDVLKINNSINDNAFLEEKFLNDIEKCFPKWL